MKTESFSDLKKLSPQLPEKIPYLKMLVLFGSRARGDTHAKSDWDFAALYDEEIRKKMMGDNAFAWFEVPQKLGDFFNLNSDNIDVVELRNYSSTISHFVARDGKLLYEDKPGLFKDFRKQALKSDLELQEIRKALRAKVEANLQRWGV
ncbi:DNA polymerase [Hydrocoleum sp. CS-953]|uniref:type VII toxin-antitoxin system MntA family adenylyltransferase antitoxin n=1 Tax=Hydrocoleum sp. CS-953 TaxID=1671698 RepID=UPI000B9A2F05|nr:nucleotidyltransferase domain-containing protein [Hydrocoleum sp. CS-953]OZH51424.1 DNA polymerase [Hydrocoleum sp. CS-953]